MVKMSLKKILFCVAICSAVSGIGVTTPLFAQDTGIAPAPIPFSAPTPTQLSAPGQQPSPQAKPVSKPNFQANVDYRQLSTPRPAVIVEPATRLRPEVAMRITVYEFFSYGCIWCYKLEPAIAEWLQRKPNTVEFVKSPVSFRKGWDTLAKLHFLADTLPPAQRSQFSTAVFKAVHEQNVNLGANDVAAKFITDYMVTESLKNPQVKSQASDTAIESARNQYLQSYSLALRANPDIDSKLKAADDLSNVYDVHAVPTFIIGGLYETNIQMVNGDPKKLMAVIDFLIDLLSNNIKKNVSIIPMAMNTDATNTLAVATTNNTGRTRLHLAATTTTPRRS